MLLNAHDMLWGGASASVAGSRDRAWKTEKQIMRLLEKGPVVISLAITNRDLGRDQGEQRYCGNRGSERPDEWI